MRILTKFITKETFKSPPNYTLFHKFLKKCQNEIFFSPSYLHDIAENKASDKNTRKAIGMVICKFEKKKKGNESTNLYIWPFGCIIVAVLKRYLVRENN